MNNIRRKKLRELKERLVAISSEIEIVRDDEQDSLDSMPENLQCSIRADSIQDNIDSLDEICENINNAIDGIEEVIL